MVTHFVLGVLALMRGFGITPAAAFVLSWISLFLDFDSACSIIDASVSGRTRAKGGEGRGW